MENKLEIGTLYEYRFIATLSNNEWSKWSNLTIKSDDHLRRVENIIRDCQVEIRLKSFENGE